MRRWECWMWTLRVVTTNFVRSWGIIDSMLAHRLGLLLCADLDVWSGTKNFLGTRPELVLARSGCYCMACITCQWVDDGDRIFILHAVNVLNQWLRVGANLRGTNGRKKLYSLRDSERDNQIILTLQDSVLITETNHNPLIHTRQLKCLL